MVTGFHTMYGDMEQSMKNDFRLKHSEIMEDFQCIEYDLKRIYSSMSSRSFDRNMDMLETAIFGVVLLRFWSLYNSVGKPFLAKVVYNTLDEIRELRNYWCHQCYLDWVYIEDSYERTNELKNITKDLEEDLNRVRNLQRTMEQIYLEYFA